MTHIRDPEEPGPPPAAAGPSGGEFPVVSTRDRVMEPLRALDLLVHVLRQGALPPHVPAILAEIARGLGDVERLVGQVFDLLSLDDGRVRPRTSPVAVDALLDALVRDCGARAAAAGAVLRKVPCSATVHTEPALLRRILREFVDNALVHAAPDRVLVGCRRRGDVLRIEVRDDGSGVGEDAGDDLFEPLMRLGAGDDGAGLGLYVVKRLAQLLGHEVGVAGASHRGSLFWIAVPAVPVRR